MNARSLVGLTATTLVGFVLLPAPVARGEDEGEPTRIDLSSLRARPSPRAARATWVPTDPNFGEQWSAEEVGEDAALQTFQEPPFADHAVSPDTVNNIVRQLMPEVADENWPLKVTKENDTLEIWAPKEGADKARAAVQFIEQSMASRLSVRAVLTASKGVDGSSRLLAAGAVRLLPRRWTGVWSRSNVRRYAAFYEIEIAQEVVANRPVIASLPEGEELYLRWSPGEKATLLEVFTSETAHRPAFDVDLSGIRNIPESNTAGAVQLPRTAVRRAGTAVTLDAGKPAVVECGWEGPDGGRTLRLFVDAAPPSPPDMDLNEAKKTAYGVVRAGAAAAPLDDSVREDLLEDEISRFNTGSSGGARGSASAFVQATAFLLCEGPKAQVDRLRAQVQAAERRLHAANVEVRAVAASAAVLREDVEAGRVAVGAALDPAVASAYLRAPIHAAARLPVTTGLRSKFQAGASVTGLASTDVEVAQQAGGIHVVPRARFDGLQGHATVVAGESGFSLRVTATVSWARPDGSSFELAFRRPFGMNNANGHPGGVDDPSVRRISIPVEGHGSAAIESDVTFSTNDVSEGRWAVLAIALRPAASPDAPAEPLLVLGTVRK